MPRSPKRPPINGTTPSDAVGYRKPPVATQFQKGVSGNPKGRPKKRKNLRTVFRDVLNQKVSVTEGGKRRKITKYEAIITQIVNKAAGGDIAAFGRLISTLKELGFMEEAKTEKIIKIYADIPKLEPRDRVPGEPVERETRLVAQTGKNGFYQKPWGCK